MWDAFGKACGQPLFRLWGGEWRTRIPPAAYLLQSDPAIVVEDARRYLEAGYETFNLKIGYDERSDIALTRAVREVVGPDRPLRLDVNGAWTPGTAKRHLADLRARSGLTTEQRIYRGGRAEGWLVVASLEAGGSWRHDWPLGRTPDGLATGRRTRGRSHLALCSPSATC